MQRNNNRVVNSGTEKSPPALNSNIVTNSKNYELNYFSNKSKSNYNKEVIEKEFGQAQIDFSKYLKNTGFFIKADSSYLFKVMDETKKKYFSSVVYDKKKFFVKVFVELIDKLKKDKLVEEMAANLFTTWVKNEDSKLRAGSVDKNLREEANQIAYKILADSKGQVISSSVSSHS